jgi:uncharacterized membrane protein YoaK (UPF0700 family)
LALTFVTGVVDAASYLRLGHVFVANVTGNAVFLGFALAGAPDVSASASLTAIGAFLVGGVAGGRLGSRLGEHRGRLLRAGVATQVAAVVAALVLALAAADPPGRGVRLVLIVLLALAMGVQNAVARRLAVPDLTTTVLTLTLTGVAADSRLAGGPGARAGRRLLSVATMVSGAVCGSLLVLDVATAAAVALAAGVLALIGIGAYRRAMGPGAWAGG